MSPFNTTRRDFLRSAAAVAAGSALPYWFTSQTAAADLPTSKNDRPHIGAIGVGGRGSADLSEAAKHGEVVAVCDADRLRAEKAKATYGGKPDVYQDYRKLLERQDIDVIINGTPDHWHTAVNLAACRAGKDVYAEKPLTLTIDEGKLLCRVVEQTGRIVQVGTQQRSERQFQTAVELARNGRVGKLRQIWVALPYFSSKGGPFAAGPAPADLDWDLYQGQAPQHAYCRQRTHNNFRWWYEYAGGIITDWGNHHVDVAHWAMDADLTGPVSVEARGLFPNPRGDDYYNTPDRFFSRMQYANGIEVLYFSSLGERLNFGEVQAHAETTPEQVEWLFGSDVPDEIKTLNRNGIMLIGDKGRVFVNRGKPGLYGKPAEELADNPLPSGAWRVAPSSDHMANFFECVKTRQTPVAPVAIEHRTVTACHLTNISLRLGRKIAWDPGKQQVVGDDEANAWQKRPQRAPYTIDV